ncbi:site-2 protease family protein [Chloroflexota bacterium]
MRTTPGLGRILGIRSHLNYTCFAAIIFMAAAVVTQFSAAYPLWHRIILGITASVFFFVAITIREFVLSLVATSKGITVKRVTIFVFGGVSQIDKETTLPALELLLGVIGMLTNLIIAGIFYVIYIVLAHTGNVIVEVLVQWLAFIYFMLFLFHLIPGFPLDGGRLLRALLWIATDNFERVTCITSWMGWSIGLLFTIGGVLILITTQQWFVGIMLAFPGLVLQNAATHSRREARRQDSTTVE